MIRRRDLDQTFTPPRPPPRQQLRRLRTSRHPPGKTPKERNDEPLDTTPDEYAAFTTPTNTPPPKTPRAHAHHGARQHWLMWLMCLPMVLLVGALIATRLGLGGLIYAAGCLLMMGLMMAWMNHGNNQPKH